MSTTSSYTIKKKAIGGYAVSYECPHCKTALTSPLQEAGSQQPCPTCNAPFLVPGKAELDQLVAKRELEIREKEQAAQKAAVAKRLADDYNAKQQEIARQDAATAAQVAYEGEVKQLLSRRRRLVLQDRNNERQPFSLQIALLILLLNAALSALGAVICALTVIGIPIAIGLAVNFAVTLGMYSVIVMINNIRHNTNEAVAHLRFQSSLLSDRMDNPTNRG